MRYLMVFRGGGGLGQIQKHGRSRRDPVRSRGFCQAVTPYVRLVQIQKLELIKRTVRVYCAVTDDSPGKQQVLTPMLGEC